MKSFAGVFDYELQKRPRMDISIEGLSALHASASASQRVQHHGHTLRTNDRSHKTGSAVRRWDSVIVFHSICYASFKNLHPLVFERSSASANINSDSSHACCRAIGYVRSSSSVSTSDDAYELRLIADLLSLTVYSSEPIIPLQLSISGGLFLHATWDRDPFLYIHFHSLSIASSIAPAGKSPVARMPGTDRMIYMGLSRSASW